MTNITSPLKLWISKDGKNLVRDGDPDAKVLFVRQGQTFPAARLAVFLNSTDHFPNGSQATAQAPIPKRKAGK